MTPPSPTPPDAPAPPPPTWRAHAVALFVTFHMVCVFLSALPRPPVLSADVLEHPEVKAELDQAFAALHRVVPWRDTPDQMRDDVFRLVAAYTRAPDRVRAVITPYLEAAG